MSGRRKVLTSILPAGREKVGLTRFDRRTHVIKAAARSHADNTGANRNGMDEVYRALAFAPTGETVGPFDGYSYRIDVWKRPA